MSGKQLNIWVLAPGTAEDASTSEGMEQLAVSLAHAGAQVTILTAVEQSSSDISPTRSQALENDGLVTRVFCPAPASPLAVAPTPVVRSFNVLNRLRPERPDLICMPEMGGLGFFVALARRLGLDFVSSHVLAVCLGPTSMRAEADGRLPGTREYLAVEYMERCSVAWADAAVASSSAILSWMAAQGWSLPLSTEILPIPLPKAILTATTARAFGPPQEIIFAGDLGRGGGLVLFVQALLRLPRECYPGLSVTFLCSVPAAPWAWDPRNWLASKMPFPWKIEASDDLVNLSVRLRRPGSLVVAPTMSGIPPQAARLCLAQGTAFLSTDLPVMRELVHPADRPTCLVSPRPAALAAALGKALKGGLDKVRAAQDPRELPAAWTQTVERMPPPPLPQSAALLSKDAGRQLSVVLVHRNRPELLAQALEGLRRQTLRGFELVLVDDGSDAPLALAALDSLEPEFAARGWRILRGMNAWLGAARNRGWRAARGRYILFHDDDNIAVPHQLERLLTAAQYSGAAVLTSILMPFEGSAPPLHCEDASELYIFLGGAVAVGLFENLYGDAHALVRRDVLDALGGFTEDFGSGHEDWEFFARVALEGYEILSVPEPLFWYRVAAGSMARGTADRQVDLRRGLRPYAALLPQAVRPALLAAVSEAQEASILRKEITALRIELATLTAEIYDASNQIAASTSLRITKPLRNALALMQQPQLDSWSSLPLPARQQFAQLLRMLTSSSWELTAPVRLIARLVRLFLRALTQRRRS